MTLPKRKYNRPVEQSIRHWLDALITAHVGDVTADLAWKQLRGKTLGGYGTVCAVFRLVMAEMISRGQAIKRYRGKYEILDPAFFQTKTINMQNQTEVSKSFEQSKEISNAAKTPSPWKRYTKGITEMRPYILGEDMSGISVSEVDDPPTDMGMIAHNMDNHADRWYISRAYFEKNYKEA